MDATLGLVFLAVLVAGGLQALAGFGFALAAVPLLAVLLGPDAAVVSCNAVVLCMSSAAAVRYRAQVQWRPTAVLAGAGVLGMPLGLRLAGQLSDRLLEVLLAALVLAFAGVAASRLLLPRGPLADAAVGVVSGALLAATGMNGPPLATALAGRSLSPAVLRATLQAVFAVQAATVVVLAGLAGDVGPEVLGATAVGLPAAALGWLLGDTAFRRTSVDRHRTVVVVVLCVSAAAALGAAVHG